MDRLKLVVDAAGHADLLSDLAIAQATIARLEGEVEVYKFGRAEWKRRACRAEQRVAELDPAWFLDPDAEISEEQKQRILAAADIESTEDPEDE